MFPSNFEIFLRFLNFLRLKDVSVLRKNFNSYGSEHWNHQRMGNLKRSKWSRTELYIVKICENAGFSSPVFSSIRVESDKLILSLNGKIWVNKTPCSQILCAPAFLRFNFEWRRSTLELPTSSKEITLRERQKLS